MPHALITSPLSPPLSSPLFDLRPIVNGQQPDGAPVTHMEVSILGVSSVASSLHRVKIVLL